MYNLNDSIIKSFSKTNDTLLINNIIESLETYPGNFIY